MREKRNTIPDKAGMWKMTYRIFIIFTILTIGIAIQRDFTSAIFVFVVQFPVLAFYWGMAWIFRNNP